MRQPKRDCKDLQKHLRLSLGKFGITANSVAPGFIETEMTKATAEEWAFHLMNLLKRSVKQNSGCKKWKT